MGIRRILILASLVAVSLAENARAADPALCRNCHTPQGTIALDLAGMPTDTFFAAVRRFRSGEQIHPVMASLSRSLPDAEITKLAAYFSALGPGGNQRAVEKPTEQAK